MDLVENKIEMDKPENKKTKRNYDTSTARNQKKIYREIVNRENEAQTQNLSFILNRLATIDSKLTSIVSSKRKFDSIELDEEERPTKKVSPAMQEVKDAAKTLYDMVPKEEDKGWNIKGNLLNLAVGAVATFTIKFAANYIQNRLHKRTTDGDIINFPPNTF